MFYTKSSSENVIEIANEGNSLCADLRYNADVPGTWYIRSGQYTE